MDTPVTPSQVYRAIIDQLVNETRPHEPGARVAERGTFSNAPAHQEYNEFIRTLSPQQRALLARMLGETRHDAIHDVLATLTWWTTAREVGFTFRGQQMPLDLMGQGLHGDYVGRCLGLEWPE